MDNDEKPMPLPVRDQVETYAAEPCVWCGQRYSDHVVDRPAGAPVPRMPCLRLCQNFAYRHPAPSAWTAFSDAMPEQRARYLLVRRDAEPSRVWLIEPGTLAPDAVDGEARALTRPGLYSLARLTHWRYALPEEG